jgi:H+-translocating NAD(P) transhydrogenase subunit alpha
MLVGVLKEAGASETRVAATPSTVRNLFALGYEVVVEPGAGDAASFSDESYQAAGATVNDVFAADIVVGVNAPVRAQLEKAEAGRHTVSPSFPLGLWRATALERRP